MPKKWSIFQEKCVFALEMMGFFLQYELGFMENVIHGAKGF
jgi:hypothetical protein